MKREVYLQTNFESKSQILQAATTLSEIRTGVLSPLPKIQILILHLQVLSTECFKLF